MFYLNNPFCDMLNKMIRWHIYLEQGKPVDMGILDSNMAGLLGDDSSVRIGISDIYYIENVERKLFIYTKSDVYRLEGSMSDVETNAADTGLVMISRTCIMNAEHLKEMKQIRNSHLEAVMDNDERLIVSRKYLPDIKAIFKRESL